jgi:hypothetical protein
MFRGRGLVSRIVSGCRKKSESSGNVFADLGLAEPEEEPT